MNKNPVLRIFFAMLSAGLSVQGMVNKTQSFDGEEDGTFICNYFCGAKDNETELISPPRFARPCIPEEIRYIYYTEQGSDHVVIKWTDPAIDGDGDSPSVIQVKGIKNGGNFTGALLGKTHTIVYIATDTDGLTDNCFFNFTVIVPSCSKLGTVQNGRYTCTNGSAPGSSCMFECHDGFKTTGTGNATCGYFSEPRQSRQSPVWKNVQQCKRIKCGIPAVPENGNLTCTNITYQTVCNVNCNHGYTAFGPKNIICQANGNWSKATVCTSNASKVTECSPSSCNGHTCLLNDNDTFFCSCSHGWSGPLCENPPDMCAGNICMNGGVCKNLNISYTCSCQLGYSGSLCQVSPVDGNWSDWSRWSKCSVTCGVGVRSRNRSCDNPPPDVHGKVCQGSYTESSDCENDKCEECPALKQTNESLSFYECKTDTDTGLKTCNITCKNGTIPVLRLEGFQTRCGHETNYYWVPGNVQVPCVVPKVPEVFELETEITYNSSIAKEQQPEVEDQVRKNINDTSCIQSGYCNTTMNFIPNQVGDYTETKLILTFLRNLDYIANNTGFVDQSVLHELQKVVSDLESTADYLRAENVFNVNTSRGLIQADESSLRLEGFINCTKGHIYVNGVCAGCPDSTSKKSHRCEFCPNRFFQLLRRQKRSQTTHTSESVDEEICAFGKCAAGTFRENNMCVFCPKGFYQEFSGKNACIICPHGKTTHTYGSNHIEHCFHHEVLRQGSYVAVIAGSVCAVFALIVSVVGTTIAYRKKIQRENEEKERKRIQREHEEKERKRIQRKNGEKERKMRKEKEEKERKMREENEEKERKMRQEEGEKERKMRKEKEEKERTEMQDLKDTGGSGKNDNGDTGGNDADEYSDTGGNDADEYSDTGGNDADEYSTKDESGADQKRIHKVTSAILETIVEKLKV